jgi:hypothetical protein
MAVETKRYSQDGISSVYIRELVAGVGTGSWKKVGGVNSASVTREVTDRELLGDNVVYRATSKFKQYTGTLGFFGQSWDMLEFFLPGSLATVGNKTTFSETTTGQPTKFELAIFSDADEEDGDVAVICEHFKNCQATNWNAPKTSGEYATFEVAFKGLGNAAGIPRDLILDEDLVGVDVATSDTTAPTVSAHVPTAAATGVVVSANLTVDFSEQMNELSVETAANYSLIKLSDSTHIDLSLATITYVVDTPFRVTINPASSLAAATEYALIIKRGVRDVAGNHMANDYVTTFTTA